MDFLEDLIDFENKGKRNSGGFFGRNNDSHHRGHHHDDGFENSAGRSGKILAACRGCNSGITGGFQTPAIFFAPDAGRNTK